MIGEILSELVSPYVREFYAKYWVALDAWYEVDPERIAYELRCAIREQLAEEISRFVFENVEFEMDTNGHSIGGSCWLIELPKFMDALSAYVMAVNAEGGRDAPS